MMNHKTRTPLLVVATAFMFFVARPAASLEPTPQQQMWLEMVNRFRASPSAELDILANYTQPNGTSFANPSSDDPDVASALSFFNVDAALLRNQFNALSPAPPLAWSTYLEDSARYYSNVIISNDKQDHFLDGLGLFDRVTQNSDYDFTGGGSVGENIYAFTDSPFQGHAGFVIDWGFAAGGIQNPPGHRNSLLNPVFREIGISIVPESNSSTEVGPFVVTQHLAVDFADGPFLTGVVFDDAVVADDFYSVGEGIGGLSVDVLQAGTTNVVASTTTYASGGFDVDVGTGLFDVRIHGSSYDKLFTDLNFSNGENQKLDWIASTTTELLGDYNANGTVDAADYTVWKDNFGSTSALDPDGNNNGVVDAADYTIWKDNFGNTQTAVATHAVPEPATLASLVAMIAAVQMLRGKREL
ncbi:MAG: CAP domain-containing protein [Pirellulaceae bacterium]|nr:hypothetical protein [Planctomycetales bacterium]